MKDNHLLLITGWLRAFKQATKGLYRNIYVTLAATFSIAIALTVLFVSVVTILVFREVVYHLQSQISIVAYIEKNTLEEAMDGMLDFIKKRPEVKSAELITPQEALNQLAAVLGEEGAIILSLDENPIPYSVEITLNYLEDAPKIITLLREIPIITEILNMGEAISRVSNLLSMVRLIGGLVFTLFTIFATILISLTVGLAIRNRKEEVLVMYLVGAPPGYIKRPFILEGLLYGFLGGAVALTILIIFHPTLKKFLHDMLRLLNPLGNFALGNWWYLWVSLIIIGAFIGALGALFATQRYLREA